MGNKYARAYLVEQSGVGIRIDLKIRRANSRRHLTKILVQGFLIPLKLYSFKIIRPDTYTKTVKPNLLVKRRGNCHALRTSTGVPSTRLIDKIDTKPAT